MLAGSSQYSPLIIAGVVSFGVTAAAVLLNDEVEFGERAFGTIALPRLKSTALDPSRLPKLSQLPEPLLQAALLVAALTTVFFGAQTPPCCAVPPDCGCLCVHVRPSPATASAGLRKSCV